MLAIVCPGQGAQKPGFLEPWLRIDRARTTLEHLAEVSDVDLVTHGTVSDAATITDTAVAQPLLVAAGILAAQELFDGVGVGGADLAAGHSVGEVTAAALTGVLSREAAMRFVALRGSAMAQAAAAAPTGMSAVVGGDRAEVAARLDELGLTLANINSSRQVVAAGATDSLERLAAEPPARTRVIPLSVAGAFHSPAMEPAREVLASTASSFRAADPSVPLVSNAGGRIVTSGTSFFRSLVSQVASGVDWEAVSSTLAAQGVTALLEVAPGGTLTGFAKRELPGVELLALNSPDDLDAARDLVSRHATADRRDA
jgi:[acyl-carrier-protein] S-malonyltransferase